MTEDSTRYELHTQKGFAMSSAWRRYILRASVLDELKSATNRAKGIQDIELVDQLESIVEKIQRLASESKTAVHEERETHA